MIIRFEKIYSSQQWEMENRNCLTFNPCTECISHQAKIFRLREHKYMNYSSQTLSIIKLLTHTSWLFGKQISLVYQFIYALTNSASIEGVKFHLFYFCTHVQSCIELLMHLKISTCVPNATNPKNIGDSTQTQYCQHHANTVETNYNQVIFTLNSCWKINE